MEFRGFNWRIVEHNVQAEASNLVKRCENLAIDVEALVSSSVRSLVVPQSAFLLAICLPALALVLEVTSLSLPFRPIAPEDYQHGNYGRKDINDAVGGEPVGCIHER